MTTIFLAGSRTVIALHPRVQDRIHKIVASGFHVVIGDAGGADACLQAELARLSHTQVTVYFSGDRPRNNIGKWPVREIETEARPSTRAFHAAKDAAMADAADYGLMLWDSESPGTLSNVLSLLEKKKTSSVFIDKEAQYLTIGDGQKLVSLVERMTPSARSRADKAISLGDRLESLQRPQLSLPV